MINDPSNVTAHLKRATVFSAKGEPEIALEVLAIASKIDADNTELRKLEKYIKKIIQEKVEESK